VLGQRPPFSELAARYGDDLAIVWVDSHPDIGTPASAYPGYHAMAVAALTGHGDPEVLALLPAIVAPERVACRRRSGTPTRSGATASRA
jgi:arginase